MSFFLNTSFTIIEWFVGLYTNSVTISSGAIHDFGDSIILFFSLLLEKKSKKGRTEKYTYGYRRFSLLGNLINIIILTIGGIFILHNAIDRLFHPQEIRTVVMLVFSILGITINGYGAFKLYSKKQGINRTLFLNIFSDFISWITVFISALTAIIFNVYFLDALCSIFLGIWLIFQGIQGSRKTLHLLMQAVPEEINLQQIEAAILQNKMVTQVHDLHVWDLDGEDYIASFHIVTTSQDIKEVMIAKEEIKIKLETLKINHATIEVDTVEQAQENGEFIF